MLNLGLQNLAPRSSNTPASYCAESISITWTVRRDAQVWWTDRQMDRHYESSCSILLHCAAKQKLMQKYNIFTALHVMQTLYCDENSVCLSVCHTRALW